MNKVNHIKENVDKYMRGECSWEELEAALKLFEDPYHILALRSVLYEQWNKREEGFQKELTEEDCSLILDKIHHSIHLGQINKPHNINILKMISVVLKIAVILIIGWFLGLSFQYIKKTEPVFYTSIVPKGSVAQMILPDNTMVFLNSGSEIKYEITENNGQREVFLNGEAWFEVVKNENMPFVVHTPFYDVKVLGTQFNVKAYKTYPEIVTTLEKGSVLITSSENYTIRENTILVPGEQLVYNTLNKSMEVKKVNSRLFTSWKENKLVFENINLKDLFVLLEGKFGVEIEVADNIVLDYHYDGTIKNETFLEVLDLLIETLPIRYKIEGQKVIIQNK